MKLKIGHCISTATELAEHDKEYSKISKNRNSFAVYFISVHSIIFFCDVVMVRPLQIASFYGGRYMIYSTVST